MSVYVWECMYMLLLLSDMYECLPKENKTNDQCFDSSTHLEKINTKAVGTVVIHMKGSHLRNHQKSNGINVVPIDQPKLWYMAIKLRSCLK